MKDCSTYRNIHIRVSSLSLLYYSATVVRLETAAYNISESDEVVQICINAAGANTCSNTDHFQLTLNTADQTAGNVLCVSLYSKHTTKMSHSDLFTINLLNYFSTVSPTDYEAVSKTVIFAPCDTRQCVNISITNDLINEPEETFTISLTLSGDAPSFIILTSATGDVLICDDDGMY